MADALHYQLISGVAGAIRSLSLEGIVSNAVYERKIPTDRDVLLPCVQVTPWLSEEMMPGTFETLERGYPVLITFLAANNQELELQEPELMWRELVLDYFDRNARLAAVGEVWGRKINPLPIVDPDLFKNKNLFAGAILITFAITKAR